MDVVVTPAPEGGGWTLTDLLGRSMGRVAERVPGTFVIEPDGQAVGTMADIRSGPHPSLDAALAEIEKHTRGICRRSD
jgi:hypothetical protein